MNTKSRIQALLTGLRDKAYRAAFVSTQIEALIPFQLRAMRARRGWTQKDLAARADMAQGRISVLENPNYEGAVNVKTLLKLAEAFDVGLVVRFAPFSEIAEWSTKLSREDHDVPDFSSEIAVLDECAEPPAWSDMLAMISASETFEHNEQAFTFSSHVLAA